MTKFDLVRVALPSEEPYSSRPSVWLNRRPYMLLMRYNQRDFIVLLDSNAPSTVWATLHHCEGATEENEALKSELSTLWQQARRIDPNSPHIVGSMTSALAQQHSQPSCTRASIRP